LLPFINHHITRITYVDVVEAAAVHIVATAALADVHILQILSHLHGAAVGAGEEEVATDLAIACD
jgi:hypothetical protein